MAIEFVPFEQRHIEAVRRFNQRLVAGNAVTPFLLGEVPGPDHSEMHRSRSLLLLEGEEVRGGFLEIQYPATLAGGEAIALNCQSPLSEGLVDPKYMLLPSQMFKVMQRKNPYVFVVGMGSLQNPLPRFLKAAGWSVEEVPFYYRVVRASRFLRQMPVLQSPPWKRAAAGLAAISGAGAAAFWWMHRPTGLPDLRPWSIELGKWGSWATELWERLRGQFQFAVTRDAHSLPSLYRAEREIGPLVIQRDGVICGWSMALLTQMEDSGHFGNLRVGTILDCIAEKGSEAASLARTVEYLSGQGADIVIMNQSYKPFQQALLDAGFRQGPSNYVLAASPKLAAAIGGKPVASGNILLTRGDGDGRINL